MANILVYSFNSGGEDYDVYLDDVTLAIFVSTSAISIPSEVPEADLPAPVGTSLYNYCVGTTRYDVLTDTLYPFGVLQVEENSLSCGYVPVDCTGLSASVTVTHESAYEAADGTADGNGSGGAGFYTYSLDGVNYQILDDFTGLAPGDYTMYVKDANGCVATAGFTINAAVQVAPTPFPWEDKVCHFFTLNDVQISEPVKWDSINVVGERDKDFHGWNYQFTDETIDLEFDCESGMSIINDVYNSAGCDGEVIFKYGYVFSGIETVVFTGRLDLKNYKNLVSRVACPVERYDGNALLETRRDVKVSMGATTTVGGSAVTPPTPIPTILHGKELRKIYRANGGPTEYHSLSGDKTKSTAYTVPDNTVSDLQEIETVFNYGLISTDTSPVADSKYLIDAKFAGSYNIHVKIQHVYSYITPVILFTPPKTSGTARFFINVDGVETPLGTAVTQAFNPSFGSSPIFLLTVDATFSTTLNVGSKVYLYVKHTFAGPSPGGWGISVTQNYNETEITALESAGESECKGWWVHDVMNHIVKSVTDGASKFRSSFFQVNPTPGQGGYNLLTNGFNIRQYEAANKPLVLSFKEALDSLKALFAIGVQYDDTVVRMERIDFFYQNNPILYIPEIYDLTREVAKEYLYNEVETGYETYQTEGYNTLDEFNTKHEYATPIKTNKLKLSAISKFIASGYSIETSRRQQFVTTATESFQNDDKAFIISMRKNELGAYVPEKNEAFDAVTGMISPTTAYNLRLSPKRMLYNWAVWLANTFHFKATGEKIKRTFVAQNADLSSDLKTADTRPVGDINKIALTEGSDVVLSDYAVERRIFIPEWIKFKCKLTPDKVDMINLALKGKYDATKNYGYLQYRDPVLGYGKGWPYKIEYNFYTEEAEITLLRKL